MWMGRDFGVAVVAMSRGTFRVRFACGWHNLLGNVHTLLQHCCVWLCDSVCVSGHWNREFSSAVILNREST